MHYGPDSWMVMFSCMCIQSRGTPTFLCIIFNHYLKSKYFFMFNSTVWSSQSRLLSDFVKIYNSNKYKYKQEVGRILAKFLLETYFKHFEESNIIDQNFGGLWPLCSSSCGGCGALRPPAKCGLFIWFCLFVFLSYCLFAFLSYCLFAFLSFCLFFLSFCLFDFLPFYLFAFLSFCHPPPHNVLCT